MTEGDPAPMPNAEFSAAQRNRETIFVEDAVLGRMRSYPGEQYVQRFHAPRCASHATAGSFVHIECSKSIPMRRPLSIMRAHAADGWIEVLFKVVGPGLRALANAEVGDTLSVIGPIGKGFTVHEDRPDPLLIGGGVGIPPMIFLAEQMLAKCETFEPLVLMGSEIDFPFDLARSTIPTKWLTPGLAASIEWLERRGICARLASQAGFRGCYEGYVTDLARQYLESLSSIELSKVEIFSCGPTPMLRAVNYLAGEFELPCQVSLEEFMACAVGGCAGCAVEVETADGPAMKRVCVDGPVFESRDVF